MLLCTEMFREEIRFKVYTRRSYRGVFIALSVSLPPGLTHAKAELTRAQISSVLHSLLFVIFGEAIGEYRAAVAPVRSDEAQ